MSLVNDEKKCLFNKKNDGSELSWKMSICTENDIIILIFYEMVIKRGKSRRGEDIWSLLIIFILWTQYYVVISYII